MTETPRTFVAVVCYGDATHDIGTVYTDGEALWVEWPDGHSDMVYRDRRGWLWDEFGDTSYPRVGRGPERTGTRLPIQSRNERDIPTDTDADTDTDTEGTTHG